MTSTSSQASGVSASRVRLQDRVVREQVVGHQQLGVVVDALEQERHGLVPVVAGGHQQQPVGLALRIAAGCLAVEQVEDLLPDLRRCTISSSICPILASARISGWDWPSAGRHHADAGVAVHVHEAQGAEAVEPDVGHPLDDLILAVVLDRLFEFLDGLGAFPPCCAVPLARTSASLAVTCSRS